jgi:two-component system sensor histidine kinase PilS (NtrC family)
VGAIVSDFLDFARPEPPAGSMLYLPRVLEEVRSSWEMDPRTGSLGLDMETVPPVSFRSDPVSIHRILMNLLSNARKAVRGVPQPSVRLEIAVVDAAIRLTVADNGCGMTKEQLDRLFVPFAGSFEEGSGLGMSLVYKFTEAMGWRIRVETAFQEGTRVELSIPSCREEDTMASDPIQA